MLEIAAVVAAVDFAVARSILFSIFFLFCFPRGGSIGGTDIGPRSEDSKGFGEKIKRQKTKLEISI